MFQKFTSRLSSAISSESTKQEEGEDSPDDAHPPSLTGNMHLPSMPSQESMRASIGSSQETLRASIPSQETLSSAATSMLGFMRKAQSAATVMVKETSTKARQVVESADMDALQKRLSGNGGLVAGAQAQELKNLDELNFTYLCDNVIAMGFPASGSSRSSNFGPLKFNSISSVAHVLNENHKGKYMIWNLSEEPYDYSLFDDAVLEFKFPGHPAPPLSLLFKICSSMENWLEADARNVAVVHCLTGKGRTSTVLACFLCWSGVVSSPLAGLAEICAKRKISESKMTIPSQRRYIQYFGNLMESVKPRSGAMVLRRAILNGIPNFSGGTLRGCCPYLQVFKNGKLVFTTTWSRSTSAAADQSKEKDKETPQKSKQQSTAVEWIAETEGSIAFTLDCLVQGDILIRCRHVTSDGRRISMFRAAFHTGYVPLGILRLTKVQLDGACQDSRFENDFFIDLIFAPIQTEDEVAVSDHSLDESTSSGQESGSNFKSMMPQSEGLVLARDEQKAYDEMLDRDEQFWTDIQRQKQERRLKTSKAASSLSKTNIDAFSIDHQEDLLIETEDREDLAHHELETILARNSETSRKDSWGEDQDAELLAQLESIETKPKSVSVVRTNPQQQSPVVTTQADKIDDLSLDFLEDDLADLNLGDETLGNDIGVLGDMDLENDDFGELEEYLEGIEQ